MISAAVFTFLFWPALVASGAEWLAVWRGWQKIQYLTKPAALALLIAWYTQAGGWQGAGFWFGIGLVASLLGDVLLMLPARFFVGGLAAFLTAHLAYLAGFNRVWPVFSPLMLAPVIIVLAVGRVIFKNILSGVQRSPENRPLKLPVMVYGTVITLMLLSALFCFWRPGWSPAAAGLASAGALFFYISDSILATSKFAGTVKNGDLYVMVTYHLGQFAIAAGVLLALR